MKLIILSSFIFFLNSTFNAQIVVSTINLPAVGDSFVFALDSSLVNISAYNTAPYNFSNLKQSGTTVNQYVINDDLVTYPQANLKMIIDGNLASASYFKATSNDLLIYGISGLNGIGGALPLPIPSLNGTLKYLSFPLSTSSNITSSDKLNMAIPASLLTGSGINLDSIISTLVPSSMQGATIHVDSIVVTIDIQSNLKTIGFGKITTPIDTNIDVLKVERTISLSFGANVVGTASILGFSVPLNLPITNMLAGQMPGGSTNMSQKSHIYYSNKYKQEIVSAAIDTATNSYQNIMYRYYTKSTTIDTIKPKPIDTIKPIDTSHHVSIVQLEIETPLTWRINQGHTLELIDNSPIIANYIIYSLSGQILSKGEISQNKIDISKLNTHPYLIQILRKNSSQCIKFIKTE